METFDHGLMAVEGVVRGSTEEVPRRAACPCGAVVPGVRPKPVIRRLADQLNVHPEALRNWIRQDQADRGERDDRPSTDMLEENRRLRKENLELRRVNEILKAASSYFAQELDPTR